MKCLVVDPNALASGIVDAGNGSPPKLIFDAIEEIAFEAVICPRLLGEVRKALRKPYFRKRVDEAEAAEALAMLADGGVMLEDPVEVEAILRDPDDDYLVALARAAGAEAIVSGDGHLLDHVGLEPPAISPRAACELLGLS